MMVTEPGHCRVRTYSVGPSEERRSKTERRIYMDGVLFQELSVLSIRVSNFGSLYGVTDTSFQF